MKFYNREKELASLEKVRQVSFSVHSQMTVLTGRRRIGKTSLIFKSCEDTPTVYLFVSRSNEADLCLRFTSEIRQALDIYVPELTNFAEMFRFLMDLGTRMEYNLVIDEFQEFYYINQEIYSLMQDTWDRLRKQSHVNLIVSGSVYTLMNKIFRDSKEPLYGRADSIMKLAPFTTSVLKEIISDHKADYTKDDLLALYTFTGGVPKYIEQFMDNGCTSMESMVDFMLQPDSSFLTEGQALLIQEFGKKYGNYFSILSAISNGKNTLPEMEAVMGGMSLGGQLKRLEEDYDLVKKKRPILSKEGSQTVRYEVLDMFLRFWFRYFIKYQNYIEIQNFERLADIIKKDYPTFSGLALEMYFRQQMMESKEFADIGSWWQGKNNKEQDEIDIVGLYAEEKKALVAEVKRQSKNFKPDLFALKVEELPILSKEGSQTVRYEVLDMFLRFWFRYFIKYQNYIEIQNFERLADIIKKDYPTFSGLALEMYFRQQMMESKEFADIGSWWQGKNNKEQDEIDIVGLYAEEKKALVAEVKRQSKNFKPDLFALKVEELRKKVLFKYEIESRLFSMEDM